MEIYEFSAEERLSAFNALKERKERGLSADEIYMLFAGCYEYTTKAYRNATIELKKGIDLYEYFIDSSCKYHNLILCFFNMNQYFKNMIKVESSMAESEASWFQKLSGLSFELKEEGYNV